MEHPEPQEPQPRAGMAVSLGEFISSRARLAMIEAADAGKAIAVKGIAGAGILASAVMAWILFVAGTVGWVSAATGTPWYLLTLIIGGVHVAMAAGLVFLIKRPVTPMFPLTKIELSNDKKWLSHLKKPQP